MAEPPSFSSDLNGTDSSVVSAMQVEEGAVAVDLDSLEHECGHQHYSNRGGWLRAGVMGASDGLVSTAGLMMGIAGTSTDQKTLVMSGVAGLVAGALSMAVGEFISVSSARDSEEADVEKERQEQIKSPSARQAELEELTQIYVERGVSVELARRVAEELSADTELAVRTHARDELGIDMDAMSNPWEAAFSSLLAFIAGALFPLIASIPFTNYVIRTSAVALSSCVGLLLMGLAGSMLGGAKPWRGAARVLIGGILAMGITYGIGAAFGVVLG